MPLQYDTPVSASSTNTHVAFGFQAKGVTLQNDGPNSVRVSLNTPATTSDFEVKSGENLTLSAKGVTALDFICAAAETATVRLLAWRA